MPACQGLRPRTPARAARFASSGHSAIYNFFTSHSYTSLYTIFLVFAFSFSSSQINFTTNPTNPNIQLPIVNTPLKVNLLKLLLNLILSNFRSLPLHSPMPSGHP